jgi:hypothetical protein
VNDPKMRKSTEMRAGYPGANSAVGPVEPPNGELRPWPAASDWASVPNSSPREKNQLLGNHLTANHKASKRAASASKIIATVWVANSPAFSGAGAMPRNGLLRSVK